ncbi:MAG: type II toxin-antitoxin system VapC family toxin [Thiomicrospira sp.]|uniref:type II toxin-antitoxin system VapC family toxin n=1 Tax=Thiomicrospira sp. TaxID=935 RepID=UPI001A0DA298|nr:type II toxin-antitoxin system VapC family toxin [Thiomicrospira sp.]MBE0493014.1 type II toxin-antitoxin system VapC family toxin [Thiomicrospira sp.]
MICLDTNVLIEILKNNPQTLDKLKQFNTGFAISSITAMELLYGALDKKELQQLQAFIEKFQIIHIDQVTSEQATALITSYAKSHTLDIPDALIAATCLTRKLPLFTYNLKDFRFIPGLVII